MSPLEHFFTYAVPSLYLALYIALGIWGLVQQPKMTFEGYAGGNTHVRRITLTTTLCAMLLSGMMLGKFNMVLNFGVWEIAKSILCVVGALFVSSLILPMLGKSSQHLTVGDVIGHTYGQTAQVATGLLTIAASFFVVNGNVRIMFLMCQYLSSPDSESDAYMGLLTLGLVLLVLLCVLLGGARSMYYTHAIAMTAALVTLLIIAVNMYNQAGAWAGIQKYFPDDKLVWPRTIDAVTSLGYSSIDMLRTMSLAIIPMLPRATRVKDKHQLYQAGVGSALLYSGALGLTLLLGYMALSLTTEYSIQGPHVHLFMVTKGMFYQSILLPCLFVGMLGICLSSINTYLHIAAVAMVQDIAKPLGPSLKLKGFIDRHPLTLTRIFAILLCSLFLAIIFIGGFAFYRHHLIWILLNVSTLALLGALFVASLDE